MQSANISAEKIASFSGIGDPAVNEELRDDGSNAEALLKWLAILGRRH